MSDKHRPIALIDSNHFRATVLDGLVKCTDRVSELLASCGKGEDDRIDQLLALNDQLWRMRWDAMLAAGEVEASENLAPDEARADAPDEEPNR